MSHPLVVEIRRGAVVESRHEVDVAVVGRDGHRSGRGNPSRGVLARSSMKPIQAVPLVETGAADAYSLTTEQLSLACASHNAEPVHVAELDDWLAAIGLDVDAFECGAHGPIHEDSDVALIRAGQEPDARHNNCSGKHCGFLTVCRHLGIDHRGYIAPEHPVQRDHITPAIEELCGVSFVGATPVIDGCGIPVWEMALDRLAGGWAALTDRPAGVQLLSAMAAAPVLMAGNGRMCTRVNTAAEGSVVVKGGAEGVFAAAVPGAGLGMALKARDGASRASEAALLWVLADLGFGVDVTLDPLRNVAGTEVGEIRVAG